MDHQRDAPAPGAVEPEEWREQLARRGFSHPRRSAYNLAAIARTLSAHDPLTLISLSLETVDPDLALNGMERLISLLDHPIPPLLVSKPILLRRLFLLAGSSEQLIEATSSCLREIADPEFTRSLLSQGPQPLAVEEGEDAMLPWHRRELIRICLAELEGEANVEQTAKALSDLADLTAQTALRLVNPEGDAPFSVIALGKWGGVELNYSSDVDFFLLRSDATDAISAERSARHFLRILGGRSQGDHLYRTDLRLRPGGAGAPLVPSLTHARHELSSAGGTWERMVSIRARLVAGHPDSAHLLLRELAEFVYESPFHLEEIRQVKGYKHLLEKRLAGENVDDQERELKVGWGGIRDVEYVVQFLQLLHGAIYPAIRGGNVFRAIRGLGRVGALTTTEEAFLLQGYTFLRRVEHHLMLRHRRQSFLLPAAADQRRALARSMNFEEWEGFRQEFDLRRRTIREIFDRLFHRLFTAEAEGTLAEVDIILAFRPEPEEIARVFKPLHFRDNRKAYALLRRLAYPRRRSLQTPRARHFLAHLFPQLLSRLRESPDPDQTVLMFSRCVETLGAPATFYQLLADKPENCNLFVDLFGRSRFLSDLLLDHPGILDELVDRLRIGETTEESNTVRELRSALAGTDPVDRARILHEFRAIRMLEIACLDLSGRASLLDVLSRLSALARALLRFIDEQVHAETTQRLGRLEPDRPGAPLPRHALIALGRLGGAEIGYSSDIDLILVYDGGGTTASGCSENEFYTQLLQGIIAQLSHPGSSGPLYPVDLRLRPHGQGGALVHSFRGFKSYFMSPESQVWEHQALVRSSYVAGDPGFGEELMHFIRAHIGRGLAPATILGEMKAMHTRRKEDPRRGGGFYLKTGPGGILDVEFLVQSALLLGLQTDTDLWEPNTAAAIRRLGRNGTFTGRETAALSSAYQFFRLVENRLSIMHRASVRFVPTDDASLRDLAVRIGYHPPASGGAPERLLLEEIQYLTETVQEIFEKKSVRSKGAETTREE